jgi:hypothetical protein
LKTLPFDFDEFLKNGHFSRMVNSQSERLLQKKSLDESCKKEEDIFIGAIDPAFQTHQTLINS